MKRGFALLEIVVAVAIVAALVGGGFYFGMKSGGSINSGVNTPASITAAEQAATTAVQENASATQAEQNALNAVAPQSSPTPASAPTTTTPTKSGDPLLGLGSNKYANGVLPLGDGKYMTSGPKKGYIYLCNGNVNPNGGGAGEDGPWISTSTWNTNQKITVAGTVLWPAAAVSITVQGSTRMITTNDLPNGTPTGIFPIQSTDPAYAYDRNPNSVKTQSLTFSFPANPTAAAAPSCIGGEVGVMTNGVMLFDGFDAENRDAVAHEVQDSCDGHPQEAGEYHYHGPSSCLAGDASTVIGFAFDGFPITGAKIAAGRYLTTSDLDECHGITSSIVLDGKTMTMYHYVMTEDFPYSVSCFRGTSTVKGPTAPSPGGGAQSASGGQQGASVRAQAGPGGTAPQPPAAAIAACSSSANGNSCSFSTPQGTISGTCGTPPGQSSLACMPAR